MRLIQLDMAAIGPFPDKVVLDFRRLDSGLFLIEGPTGAGKTSLFDAICYALYERASGEARERQSLRSDFAKPEQASYIRLRFSQEAAVYEVERKLAYLRPKLRGTGLTRCEATHVLRLPDGRELNRRDEVNDALAEIIGLAYEQFRQTAMLAQGEFKRLLLAKSDERGAIFRQIFGSDIFLALQAALQEEQKEAKERYEGLWTDRLRSLEGLSLTAPWRQAALEELLRSEKDEGLDVQAMLHVEAAELQRRDDKIQELQAERQAALRNLQDRLLRAKAEKEAQAAHRLAQEALARHLEAFVQESQRAEAIARAEEAKTQLAPFYRQAEAASDLAKKEGVALASLAEEAKEAQEAWTKAVSLLSKAEAETPAFAARVEARAIVRQQLPQYALKDRAQAQAAAAQKKLGLAQERQEALQEQAKQLQEAWQSLQSEVESQEALAIQEGEAQRHWQQCKATLHGLTQWQGAKQRCALLDEQLRQAKRGLQDALEDMAQKDKEVQRHNQLWLRSQATILALELEAECPCPVCGSKEHPAPASPEGSLSLDEAKQALDEAKDQARSTREAFEAKEKAMQHLRAAVDEAKRQVIEKKEGLEQLGPLPAGLPKAHEEALPWMEKALQKAETFLQDTRQATQALQEGRKNLKAFEARGQEIQEEQRSVQSLVEEGKAQVSEAKARLEERVLALPFGSAEEARAHLAAEDQAIQAQEEALAERRRRERESKERWTQVEAARKTQEARVKETDRSTQLHGKLLREALEARGYPSLEAYRASAWSDERLQEEQQIRQRWLMDLQAYKAAVKAAETRLPKGEVEELEGLERAYERLQEASLEAAGAHATGQAQRHRLALLLNQERRWQEELAEARQVLIDVSELAQVATGQLAGGSRLSFEAYVQAYWFERVLQAANTRLEQMSHGRFLFRHREKGEDRRQRAGLGLNVLDRYTGLERDAATLSGGESFMAALALALGLADMAAHREAGRALETLFIDEGFGSLDQEALGKAIQVLQEQLGGQTLCGIISHVEELKDMIPMQVQVLKSEAGSRIRLKTEGPIESGAL